MLACQMIKIKLLREQSCKDLIQAITSQGHAWSWLPEVLTGNFQWIQIMGLIIKELTDSLSLAINKELILEIFRTAVWITWIYVDLSSSKSELIFLKQAESEVY